MRRGAFDLSARGRAVFDTPDALTAWAEPLKDALYAAGRCAGSGRGCPAAGPAHTPSGGSTGRTRTVSRRRPRRPGASPRRVASVAARAATDAPVVPDALTIVRRTHGVMV